MIKVPMASAVELISTTVITEGMCNTSHLYPSVVSALYSWQCGTWGAPEGSTTVSVRCVSGSTGVGDSRFTVVCVEKTCRS